MSWSRCSELMLGLIDLAQRHIPDRVQRTVFYLGAIALLEEFDWDTHNEAMDEDPAFDDAIFAIYPGWQECHCGLLFEDHDEDEDHKPQLVGSVVGKDDGPQATCGGCFKNHPQSKMTLGEPDRNLRVFYYCTKCRPPKTNA